MQLYPLAHTTPPQVLSTSIFVGVVTGLSTTFVSTGVGSSLGGFGAGVSLTGFGGVFVGFLEQWGQRRVYQKPYWI